MLLDVFVSWTVCLCNNCSNIIVPIDLLSGTAAQVCMPVSFSANGGLLLQHQK